ncbi:MAG: hypothetical protein ACREQO_13160 [Candidatus Binatia bacterium]
MAHANSLRVMGQLLETAKIQIFELATDGSNYVVYSDSLTAASHWILRHTLNPNSASEQSAHQPTTSRSIRFALSEISDFDQAQKQKRINSSSGTRMYRRLSQLLRALGDHFDRAQVKTFQVSWTANAASVDFQSMDGRSDSRIFTAEKLEQLGSHSRFLRASRAPVDINLPAFTKQSGPWNR